jgi:hypothetical protein
VPPAKPPNRIRHPEPLVPRGRLREGETLSARNPPFATLRATTLAPLRATPVASVRLTTVRDDR